jgi:hypothetical protein
LLLAGEGEALTRKAVELALAGDPTALRLCLERIVGPYRERPVEFTMPPIRNAADLPVRWLAQVFDQIDRHRRCHCEPTGRRGGAARGQAPRSNLGLLSPLPVGIASSHEALLAMRHHAPPVENLF